MLLSHTQNQIEITKYSNGTYDHMTPLWEEKKTKQGVINCDFQKFLEPFQNIDSVLKES